VSRRQSLVLPLPVRRALIAHAKSSRPRECCGFLIGARRRVLSAIPMRNVARGTSSYRISDAEHIAVRRAVRLVAASLDIVGVYHSHPTGRAWPSPTDIARSYYPEWVHLIVGLGPVRPDVRAFRIRNGRVEQVMINRLSDATHLPVSEVDF
jgi:[CysO sulfur-carrier protein]-S-L-cysteine hydrolase